MAMRGENSLVGVGHALAHRAEHRGVLVGHRVADSIGQVDGRRARLDRGIDAPAEIVDRRARGVHRRPLDIVHQIARLRNGLGDDREHVVLGLAHLVRQMDRRGRHECVDARLLRRLHRLARTGDVGGNGAREAGDGRVLHLARDFLHALEVALARNREARLDDVDTHLVENFGDLQFLLEGHRRARRLLAVAQRGVENDDAILFGRFSLGSHCFGSLCLPALSSCGRVTGFLRLIP